MKLPLGQKASVGYQLAEKRAFLHYMWHVEGLVNLVDWYGFMGMKNMISELHMIQIKKSCT